VIGPPPVIATSWHVPLTCTRCGHEALPRYDGWTQCMAARFGDRSTIYADLFCDHCGEPDYVFLGMLGRSYCYRCSSCGRLLRLRD
jgi:hypothetical protein